MIPLYAARISDFGPGDYVEVESITCAHIEMVPIIGLAVELSLR